METDSNDEKDFILFLAIAVSVIAGAGLYFSPPISSDPTSEESIRNMHNIKKITLEGHDYWHFTESRRGGGMCHSESCHCKTNDSK